MKTKTPPLLTRLDGYVRVSRVGGRSGDSFISPDVQRRQIQEWADRRGVTIGAWHEDLDQSGGTLKRPGFQAALARIEAGESAGLIVPRLDRFGRSVPRIYEALERIEAAGGQLVSVAEDFDLSTAAGKAHLNMLGMMAQYQRDLATEAWDVSNARAIERGIHFTRVPPFGYLRDPETRRLVPDTATAPLVVELFSRRATRSSWRQLADYLNDRAPRTDGREWGPRNAAVIVQNRAYLGEAWHGAHRNPEAHPAIVTLDEWEAANAIKGGPGAISRERSALLAGLMRCAGCRYAMRRTFATYRDGRRVMIYSCRGKQTGGKCSAPASVMAHVVEPVVVDRFLTFLGGTHWEVGADDDRRAEEAARQLAHAEAKLAAFLADDELRDVVGREAYLAEARKRQHAVDDALALVNQAKGEAASERRQYLLAIEWARWGGTDREELRGETLRRALDAVYVRQGRGSIEERVLLRWDGEDRFERPQRGTTTYKTCPIPWPEFGGSHDAFLASVPEWAWRNGHPAIPEDVRADVHSIARADGLPHVLPDAA